MCFFEQEGGLSSLVSNLVEARKKQGFVFKETKTEVTTLTDIFESYVGDRDVHFLKIDGEGNETNVLTGGGTSIDFVLGFYA